MRPMKDSGIEWIGEIPVGWDVKRLRFLCTIITGDKDTINKKIDGLYPFYVRSPNIERIDSYTFDGEAILMAGDGVGAGKVFHYVNGKFDYHQRVYNLHFFNNIYGKYLFYYLKENFWKKIEESNAKSTVDSVRLPMLLDFPVVSGDLNEQTRIASFLDTKCAAIDAAIENQRATIDKLKEYRQAVITEAVTKGLNKNTLLKNCDIPWIPNIPDHWQFQRIKNAIFPLNREILPNDDVITCFRDGEVTLRKKRRGDGFTFSFTEHGYQGVEVGDLAIHGMDAFAGAIGCSSERGKCTPVVHICETCGNNRYFMYFLRSMAFNDIFMAFSNGVRIRSSDYRNWSKLAAFLILIPPISEQHEIAAYLDQKCTAVDSAVDKKETLIEKLTKYKKSLIYEVVTGKMEVPV